MLQRPRSQHYVLRDLWHLYKHVEATSDVCYNFSKYEKCICINIQGMYQYTYRLRQADSDLWLTLPACHNEISVSLKGEQFGDHSKKIVAYQKILCSLHTFRFLQTKLQGILLLSETNLRHRHQNCLLVEASLRSVSYPFKTRIKFHLLFAGIIRSSPFSPRQWDKG